MDHDIEVAPATAGETPPASAPPSDEAGGGSDGERGTGEAGAGGGASTGSGTRRRRRRRGGRGRGGRGGGGGQRPAGEASADGEARTTEGPGAPAEGAAAEGSSTGREAGNARTSGPARRPRTQGTGSTGDAAARSTGEASAASTGEAAPAASTSEDGGSISATPARRRRRRGGRGRGRGGAAGSTTTATAPDGRRQDAKPEATTPRAASAPDADDQPSLDDPPAAQRSSSGRSRSRRSRGRRDGAGHGGQPATAPAASKPATIEEQVAAGGPTRGLRSSRTRRDGRRRRREPMPIPPRVTNKTMVITEHGERDQIAVLEDDVLVQHYVTRGGATSMVGNVYLGRVQNVLPGMEAAFVDVGRGRNGVLYAGEVNYSPEDLEGPAPRIEQVLKAGQSVIVQVTKDPMGGKGARLTANISLAGRFTVLAPDQELSGISRRLDDAERRRLKSILRSVKPDQHGLIVRTAAEGAPEESLVHDVKRLLATWDEIQRKAKKAKAPAVLYEEPELTVRVVRDMFTDEEFRGLVTDSPRIYERVAGYVRDVAPDLIEKIRLHEGPLSAFEEHRVVEQIHKALDRKVWLPSGGYLIIERTEAMTIIDVNTGKAVGKTNLEETVVNTNLEAAREAARQLRLRDIGGIIVIDFIDMLLEQNKAQVEDAMREALALDKTRSQVFEIGPLGLMQVTRKRVSSGLVESFSETCPHCEGRGFHLTYDVE